ncbi:MAG: ABC transporter permease [Candidatus Cloacimonetes bacterium]|nr:ABC transporter permease [Candidatus Cloacimonadota bacterium]
MSKAFLIANKEFMVALRTVAIYFIFAIFLGVVGVIFSSTLFKVGRADLRSLFSVMHLIFLFYIPALTMGTLAREKSSGTFEVLSVSPIRLSSVVWGKFLASWALVFIAMALTLFYLVILVIFGRGIDFGAIACGYLGLLLIGGVYTSVGIFASSIQSNQVLAFVLGLGICALMYIVQFMIPIIPPQFLRIFQFISIDYHYQNFQKGVVDSRDLIYLLSLMTGFNILSELKLKSQNLMSER